MLENQEKALRREKRFTMVLWIYLVMLTTVLMVGSGLLMIHKIEGTWMAVNAVLWFLFGPVFLLSHLMNKSRFEVIKEIKGVELRWRHSKSIWLPRAMTLARYREPHWSGWASCAGAFARSIPPRVRSRVPARLQTQCGEASSRHRRSSVLCHRADFRISGDWR